MEAILQGADKPANGVAREGKPDLLLMLHIPPPVHGSSVVGKAILDSRKLDDAFIRRHLNLLASRNVEESGRVSFGKLAGFANLVIRLAKQLIYRRPDLCYFALTTTGAAFFRDAMLCGMLKICKVPIVFHLHNKGVLNKSKSLLYRLTYRYVFSRAHVILLSEHLYPDVANFVPRSHVRFCSNGIVDTAEKIQPPAKQQVSPSCTSVNILFLSNLITSKGVYVLLEACALLKTRGLDFQCNFIGAEGDISAQEFQEKTHQLALDEHVNYLGPKYGAEKFSYLGRADIFVLPTFYECFPLVVLEAMSFSIPVVSCPEGGIPDQISDGRNGFLVAQRNAEDLANRLEDLVKDPALRSRMGKAGREKFETHFTLDAFEDRIVNILRGVATDSS